jgi:hypothetical protein
MFSSLEPAATSDPGSDEISETVDFMTYLHPEEKIKKTSRTDRPFRLLTINKSMASIETKREI